MPSDNQSLSFLARIRVVLVNTTHTGNIGATARAMKNMGLSRLTLVEPRALPDEAAYARSSGAGEILQQAVIVPDLKQAIADCHLVMGTSARKRYLSWPLISPQQMAIRVAQTAHYQHDTEIALVFGREDRGLTNEELALCHYHVHIPADTAFSSLNLAAAVQVLAYELRLQALADQDPSSAASGSDVRAKYEIAWQEMWDTPWATAADMERFYEHLEQVLTQLDFYDPDNPRHLIQKLRRFYQRAHPDQNELNILRGILSAIERRTSSESRASSNIPHADRSEGLADDPDVNT